MLRFSAQSMFKWRPTSPTSFFPHTNSETAPVIALLTIRPISKSLKSSSLESIKLVVKLTIASVVIASGSLFDPEGLIT